MWRRPWSFYPMERQEIWTFKSRGTQWYCKLRSARPSLVLLFATPTIVVSTAPVKVSSTWRIRLAIVHLIPKYVRLLSEIRSTPSDEIERRLSTKYTAALWVCIDCDCWENLCRANCVTFAFKAARKIITVVMKHNCANDLVEERY